MRRDLNEVLASQAKMLERRGEPNEIDDATMIELYENDLWKANYLLKKNPQFETLMLNYREVLDSPEDQARRLNEFLGGRYEVEKMAAAVDPSLYRNRAEALATEKLLTRNRTPFSAATVSTSRQTRRVLPPKINSISDSE